MQEYLAALEEVEQSPALNASLKQAEVDAFVRRGHWVAARYCTVFAIGGLVLHLSRLVIHNLWLQGVIVLAWCGAALWVHFHRNRHEADW